MVVSVSHHSGGSVEIDRRLADMLAKRKKKLTFEKSSYFSFSFLLVTCPAVGNSASLQAARQAQPTPLLHPS
jgi:hypothetical protein